MENVQPRNWLYQILKGSKFIAFAIAITLLAIITGVQAIQNISSIDETIINLENQINEIVTKSGITINYNYDKIENGFKILTYIGLASAIGEAILAAGVWITIVFSKKENNKLVHLGATIGLGYLYYTIISIIVVLIGVFILLGGFGDMISGVIVTLVFILIPFGVLFGIYIYKAINLMNAIRGQIINPDSIPNVSGFIIVLTFITGGICFFNFQSLLSFITGLITTITLILLGISLKDYKDNMEYCSCEMVNKAMSNQNNSILYKPEAKKVTIADMLNQSVYIKVEEAKASLDLELEKNIAKKQNLLNIGYFNEEKYNEVVLELTKEHDIAIEASRIKIYKERMELLATALFDKLMLYKPEHEEYIISIINKFDEMSDYDDAMAMKQEYINKLEAKKQASNKN